MKKPEEIKKGLECCYGHAERRFCEECPWGAKVEGYSEVICTDFDSVGEGAIAYIQQLEAKLAEYEKPLVPLPLDDILKLDDTGDAWWVEYKGGNLTPTILTNDCRQYGEQILHGYVFKLYDYSKTWRCWARKPTDEERKAVKWDD